MSHPPSLDRLAHLLGWDGRTFAECRRLARIAELFLTLPDPPEPIGLYPRWAELRDSLAAAVAGDDAELLEERLLELYAHLHGHAAPYTPDERSHVDASGGYWAHAGGLSPILRAPEELGADSASIDYGAGNGLQLLLVQKLAPHRCTVQVEISSRMIEAGKALQSWLGVEDNRVEWRCADVGAVSPAEFDFIYLYRPVRPDGPGGRFYTWFTAELARTEGRVVIYSIADCLRPFLGPEFETVSSDGHLTCYLRAARR